MKKIFLVALLFLFMSVFAFQVKAMTVQEKQNLIYQITQQIAQLQAQLNQNTQQQSSSSAYWCHDFSYNMKNGDVGGEVSALQTALTRERLAISDYEIQNLKFGDTTEFAVNSFQEKYKSVILTPNKLKIPTGNVASATRKQLNNIYGCSALTGCFPNWVCSAWGNCSSAKQTRTCKDVSNCNVLRDKPLESQECLVSKLELLGNGQKQKVTINAGDSVLLSWSSGNMVSCTAGGNWIGIKNAQGTESTGYLLASKIYNLTCKDVLGKVFSVSLSVEVLALKVDVKVNGSDGPVTVEMGKDASIKWTSVGATSCVAAGNWIGDKALSGTESTGFFNYFGNFNYAVTCSGTSGSVTDVVMVKVLPPSVDIKVNNLDGQVNIISGKSASLKWTSSGVSNCTASGAWSGSKANTGTQSTGNLYSTAVYAITCQDVNRNNIYDSVMVNVTQ